MDINAQLPANTGIAEDDLCTVLTNLLDNAIESMDREKENLPGDTPVIRITLRSIHHFLVINVSNPCIGHSPIGPRLFLTSKKDNIHHGWGLKSVRKTVHKYNGSLSLEMTDGRFTATAMMFYI